MIPPQDQQDETAVSAPGSSRLPLLLSLLMTIVLAAVFTSSRALLTQNGQTLFLGPINPLLILSAVIGVYLVWRKKVVLGTGVLAVVYFVALGISISQRAGFGLALIISITFVVAVLISHSWPKHLLFPGMVVLIGSAIAILLADLYWPVPRPAAPEFLRPIFLGAAVFMILLIIFLVFREFASYALRTKLLVNFMAVTLIPLSLLSFFSSQYTRAILIKDANKILLTAAAQTAVTLDDFFKNNENDIRAEANIIGTAYDWDYFNNLTDEERLGPVGTLAEQKAVSLLRTYRDKDPINIASYALLDMEGQVLFEYPPGDTNSDESGWSYYTEVVKTGRAYISPVEFLPETNQAYFHFSAVVMDNLGKQVGVLRARYKASILQPLITRSTGLVGGQSFAVLFDENQMHLAHGTAPETIFKLVALPAPEKIAALQAAHRLPHLPTEALSMNLATLSQNLENITTQPFFTATDAATGERINQVAVAFMEEQPWQVAFFQPQDVFLEPVQVQTRRTVVLALLISGIVAAVAVGSAYFLTRPIIALEALAAKVAEGDLTVHAPVTSGDEVGALAHTFNMMTAQLKDLFDSLEKRVADRTRALEISGDVSRQLSAILDRQELVTAVVKQVQQAFNYYHVHIYLFDDTNENLVMVGGTGDAGQTMLQQGHKIQAGKGLVGRAGQFNATQLVPDVTLEPGWLPNPLLPNTQAEIAVPIAAGERVLGVLDVQHDQLGGLDEADAGLLRSIAGQVANALQNARLYEQTQQQAEHRSMLNIINQKILSTNTIEDAMKTAVRELGRTLNVPHTGVKLNQGQPENSKNSNTLQKD